MPAHGGTTCRFMRPRALTPPTVQLGNSGIDPPAQVPQRDIIDAQVAFFGTGCIINEQVKQYGLYKFSLIDLELLAA
jgi:hypothetical protein